MARKPKTEALYILTYEEISQFETLMCSMMDAFWEIMDYRRVEVPPVEETAPVGPAVQQFVDNRNHISAKNGGSPDPAEF
jgi:hypothetical protein